LGKKGEKRPESRDSWAKKKEFRFTKWTEPPDKFQNVTSSKKKKLEKKQKKTPPHLKTPHRKRI